MIEEVGREEVLEIWKVVDIRSEKRHNIHFVIIVNAVYILPMFMSQVYFKRNYMLSLFPCYDEFKNRGISHQHDTSKMV